MTYFLKFWIMSVLLPFPPSNPPPHSLHLSRKLNFSYHFVRKYLLNTLYLVKNTLGS